MKGIPGYNFGKILTFCSTSNLVINGVYAYIVDNLSGVQSFASTCAQVESKTRTWCLL